MTEKKPVRVNRYKSKGHKLETRVFAREIHETYCVDPRCKFNGRPAAQGVCHTRLRKIDNAYLERVERSAKQLLAETREIRKRQKMSASAYISYLEQLMFCDWMNAEFGLDELIRLRAKVARLELRADKYQT